MGHKAQDPSKNQMAVKAALLGYTGPVPHLRGLRATALSRPDWWPSHQQTTTLLRRKDLFPTT